MFSSRHKNWRLSAAVAALVAFSPEVFSGVWLNMEDANHNGISLQSFNNKLNWLDSQNDRNPNLDPWVGMRVYLTWGEIPYTGDKSKPATVRYDFSHLVDLLNAAYNRNDRHYKVALTISDKLWAFDPQGDGTYNYAPGALPRFYAEDLGAGDWVNSAVRPSGSNKTILVHEDENKDGVADDLRFAVADSNTNSHPVRKYSTTRWNPQIQALWFDFWKQLANYTYIDNGVSKKLKNHPALHSIITPESSISGINHDINELNTIGYVGAQAYSDYLRDQAQKLAADFPAVRVLSSINWISENTKTKLMPFYQNYLGDQLSGFNQSLDQCGWFAQDLRLDADMDNASYENLVYPEFAKFDKSLRYVMITGDTYNNSTFTSKTTKGKAKELLTFADDKGVGQLFFLQQSQGANTEIFNLIASANYGDYSFLPAVAPTMLRADMYEGAHADRITLLVSEPVSQVSAAGFTVSVNGRAATITDAVIHPTDATKIWVTLATRVYQGDLVKMAYSGMGSTVDGDDNKLEEGAVVVTNHTTQ